MTLLNTSKEATTIKSLLAYKHVKKPNPVTKGSSSKDPFTPIILVNVWVWYNCRSWTDKVKKAATELIWEVKEPVDSMELPTVRVRVVSI